jgi:hypothetical protein
LKLVASKPALLRVYATATTAGLSTQVRATFSSGGNPLGTVTLDGPATVPTSVNQADLTQSYRTVLPANWVKPGLQVKLEVDPNNTVGESDEANNVSNITPTVGAGTVLYVTVVPIQQNGLTGVVPAGWDQMLTKLWPLQSVNIKTRATFLSSRVLTSGASTNNDWSELLDDLANLRVNENSHRYYYGFAKVGYSSGVAGIGYVGFPVGMGWDYASSAPGVTAHEIGHTFGMLHAPCGATSGLDPQYPANNGKLDGWGFDVASLKLYDPSVNYDVMSYCGQNGKQWVSSYMYNKAQSALEADPPQATSVINGAALSTSDSGAGINERLVIVSGRIRNGAVELRPLEGFTGRASKPRPGVYRLRLETAGGTFETPFASQSIAHGDISSFTFTVPDHGNVSAIEIWRDGTRLLRQAAGLRSLSVWTEPELHEQAGRLELHWDTSAFRSATLAHVATDGERTVVGLQLERATTLDVRALPAGGRFELTLSDGLNSVQRTFQR